VAYKVNIEHFEGPLDLLLQLVEQDELEISKLSLANLADQFVQYMNAQAVPPEELADFLVIASKLVYMKSQLLLPGFSDQELEEGPDLESQLRQYQLFVAAARQLDAIWLSGRRSFARGTSPMRRREVKFVPPPNVDMETLKGIMQRVIARLEPIINLPKAAVRRAVSLHDRIRDLFTRIKKHATMTFHSFLKDATHKEEAVVSFLALLELIKQRFVTVDQQDIFRDIDIKLNPDAPENDPLADSFI
jgi:segregation and condensation protein A